MPGTSIAEVMEVVESLPFIQVGDPIWHYATFMFLDKQKREMFAAMKTDSAKYSFLDAVFKNNL